MTAQPGQGGMPAPCPRCTGLGDAHYLTCPTLRRQGIHAMWPLPDGSGVGVCCECRAQTEIIFDTGGVTDWAHIDLPEQSFTCGGCGTTHWFRIGAGEAPVPGGLT